MDSHTFDSSHWYLAIICNLQHLDRKLQTSEAPADSAAIDSDGTIVDDPKPHKTRLTPSSEPDKMDIVQDNGSGVEIADTQTCLENMSVEEESEWPEENEVDVKDSKLESKNSKVELNKGTNNQSPKIGLQKDKATKKQNYKNSYVSNAMILSH